MSPDICLEFREKPKDLDSVLAGQGFDRPYITKKSRIFPVQIRHYFHSTGVVFTYHDGTYCDRNWKDRRAAGGVSAMGTLSDSRGQQSNKQEEIGKFLRDYYKAILENSRASRN